MKINSKERLDRFYQTDKKIDSAGVEHSLSRTSLKRKEVDYLTRLIGKYKPVATLEIGLALGASAVGIIAAKLEAGITEKHIALDPFQQKHGRDVGIDEIKALNLFEYFIHYPLFSEDYLNKCYESGKQFDFIFIDGSHTIGQAVTDAFLGDKILNANGIIAIHDAAMFSTAASVKYLVKERGYSIVGANAFNLKTVLKMIKYLRSLGVWYCFKVLPKLNQSLIALRKG